MPLPRPALVVFDMDGTIVRHLNPAVLHALELADDTMYRVGRILHGLGKMVGYPFPWHTRNATRKPRLIVHRTLHKLRRKPVEQIVEPCPGILDLLDLFTEHRIPLALISNGLGQGYGDEILEKFDLGRYFKATVFREDTTKAKPDPEPLIKAMNDAAPHLTSSDAVWYIGDRAKDMVVALRAKTQVAARVIPVAYGLHGLRELLRQNQDALGQCVLSYDYWYPEVQRILKTAPIPASSPLTQMPPQMTAL